MRQEAIQTHDGLRLAATVYPEKVDHEFVVVFLHGLASNRLTFDFPGRSLAQHVNHLFGVETRVLALRGATGSERRGWKWTLHDHLESDLEAHLSAINHKRVILVGHSMGAILSAAFAATNPGRVHGVVGIAGGFDYTVGSSAFAPLAKLQKPLGKLPYIPYRHLAKLSGATARFGKRSPAFFNVNPKNIESGVSRRIHNHCFTHISTELMLSLKGVFDAGGLTAKDGATFGSLLRENPLPYLAIGGTCDVQVSTQAVTQMAEHTNGTLRLFGCEHGHRNDYGHFDLVLGRWAHVEVWPTITHWIDQAITTGTTKSALT